MGLHLYKSLATPSKLTFLYILAPDRLNYDKYESTIQKNLTQLRDGLKTLEQQLSAEEQSGAAQVDLLHTMLGIYRSFF